VNARKWIVAAGLLAGALVCARLGFWQLARLAEKRVLNERVAATLAEPPMRLLGTSQPIEELRGRRVGTSGQYDESRHILLSGIVREGEPGVHVLTPLMLPIGGAVLVDRGWLEAQDGVTARPQDVPEPGQHWIVGVAETLASGVPTPAWRVLEADSVTIWSVHALGRDSVQTHFPYPVAGFTLRQLPAADLPDRPRRTAPEPLGTTMHLSYAIQWFLFAAAFAAGALFTLSRPSARTGGTNA
jgi:surfeit locus 1 family protein